MPDSTSNSSIKCKMCQDIISSNYYLFNNSYYICSACFVVCGHNPSFTITENLNQELLENETIRNLNVELDNLNTTYTDLIKERNDLVFLIKKTLSLLEDDFKVSDAIDLFKSELKHYGKI